MNLRSHSTSSDKSYDRRIRDFQNVNSTCGRAGSQAMRDRVRAAAAPHAAVAVVALPEASSGWWALQCGILNVGQGHMQRVGRRCRRR
jgi:hypothetical protein